jgi:hypothetical protein
MLLKDHVCGQRARRAIAATELACLLPFLLFMWVIAIDWARIFYYTVTLEYAARDGAYWGGYSGNYPFIYDYSSINDAALGESTNISPTPTVTATYDTVVNGSYTSTSAAGANYIQVQVSYNFTTITNYPGVPTNVTVTRQVRMAMAPLVPGM